MPRDCRDIQSSDSKPGRAFLKMRNYSRFSMISRQSTAFGINVQTLLQRPLRTAPHSSLVSLTQECRSRRHLGHYCSVCFIEIKCHCVVLKFMTSLLPQPPLCWRHRWEPTLLAFAEERLNHSYYDFLVQPWKGCYGQACCNQNW